MCVGTACGPVSTPDTARRGDVVIPSTEASAFCASPTCLAWSPTAYSLVPPDMCDCCVPGMSLREKTAVTGAGAVGTAAFVESI